jgi:hypothetical protein
MKKTKFADVLVVLGLLSIVASVVIFSISPIEGLFVGLWAPTLISTGNYFKE